MVRKRRLKYSIVSLHGSVSISGCFFRCPKEYGTLIKKGADQGTLI